MGVKSSSVGYSGIHPTTATQLNGASKAFRRHGATSGPGLRRHCPPQVGDGFWFSTWSLSNCTSEDKRTESEGEEGGGGPGLWPSPAGGGRWVVVLVYCLSAGIFIKLWGQMESDALPLLWRGGLSCEDTAWRNLHTPVE